MALLKLNIHAVRNILKESIIPAATINFFYGENGSGKSTLIEAIYILGRAKSFRSTSIKSVIHVSEKSLIVSAQVIQSNRVTQLGVQLDNKNISCHINHQPTQKRSDLAYALPLQIIHPKSYELLDAGPQLRREYLDWGVFHNDQNFLLTWGNFKRVLSQRNALLKSKRVDHIDVWNKELVYYGTIVNNYREEYLQKLKPVFLNILDHFIQLEGIELKLVPGWDNAKDFHSLLIDSLEHDVRYGFTHYGPHRGDFQLLVHNRLAKEFVSRGQLKLLVISLKLAQMQLLTNVQNTIGCFLLDDFAAELDGINREKLLDYLSKMKCQVFITATEQSDFGDLTTLDNYKMFHVEHGNIKQV